MVTLQPGETKILRTFVETENGIDMGPYVTMTNTGKVQMDVHKLDFNGTVYSVAEASKEPITGSN